MLIRRALKIILFNLHLQRSPKNVDLYLGTKKKKKLTSETATVSAHMTKGKE